MRMHTFSEAPPFEKARENHLNDRDYRLLQLHLALKADAGDVMPGCGGLRKLRWSATGSDKGKRGGLRIIYLFVPEIRWFHLFTVYDKTRKSDLTPDECKTLSRIVAIFREELVKRQAGQGEKS